MSNLLDYFAFLVVFLFVLCIVAGTVLILFAAFRWWELVGGSFMFVVLMWSAKRLLSNIDIGSGW